MTSVDPLRTAVALLNAGRLGEARDAARTAVASAPADARALAVLAAVHDALGELTEATTLMRRLTEIEPGVAIHWANLGTVLRNTGAFGEAQRAYDEARRRGLRSAEFLLNVALLHLDRFEGDKARTALAEAAVLDPRSAEIRYFQAIAAYQDVDYEQAQQALAVCRSLQGLSADLLIRMGALLTQLGETAEAESTLREALRLEPGNALAIVRLAQALERSNQLEEAERELAAAGPGAASAELAEERLALEARLAERRGDFAAAAGRYRRLAEGIPQLHLRYHALFQEARALDSLGSHGEALQAARCAHESQVAFLAKAAPRFVSPAQRSFNIVNFGATADDCARWDSAGAPDAARSPVFIVGFPRSGTTLLEQALDAHPQLRSMDEQPFLQNAIDDMRRHGALYAERLADLTPEQCEAVRSGYGRRVAARVQLAPGQRLVDKNPLNLLRLAAIMRLFPNARILVAIRHPCDVLLSNYFQHYRAPEIAAMCRDIGTLADGYRRAFDFWYAQRELLRPTDLEVVYEDFVSDFEAQMRRIASFLELPWHDAMLEPAANARRRGYISTPSYSQVVEPVNRRAVGRWRHYAAEFTPVVPVLRPLLARWRYEARPSEEQVG